MPLKRSTSTVVSWPVQPCARRRGADVARQHVRDCRARRAASLPRDRPGRTRRRSEAGPRRARMSSVTRTRGEAGAACVEQADDVAVGDAARRRIARDACARPRGRDASRRRLWPPKSSWLCSRVAGWLATRMQRRRWRSAHRTGASQAGWPGQSASPKPAMVSEKISMLAARRRQRLRFRIVAEAAQRAAVVGLLRHDQAAALPRTRRSSAPARPCAASAVARRLVEMLQPLPRRCGLR